MKIYLVNQYDKHCPENNNGDMIIAAFSSEEGAKRYIDKLDQDNGYSIQMLFVDPDYSNGR